MSSWLNIEQTLDELVNKGGSIDDVVAALSPAFSSEEGAGLLLSKLYPRKLEDVPTALVKVSLLDRLFKLNSSVADQDGGRCLSYCLHHLGRSAKLDDAIGSLIVEVRKDISRHSRAGAAVARKLENALAFPSLKKRIAATGIFASSLQTQTAEEGEDSLHMLLRLAETEGNNETRELAWYGIAGAANHMSRLCTMDLSDHTVQASSDFSASWGRGVSDSGLGAAAQKLGALGASSGTSDMASRLARWAAARDVAVPTRRSSSLEAIATLTALHQWLLLGWLRLLRVAAPPAMLSAATVPAPRPASSGRVEAVRTAYNPSRPGVGMPLRNAYRHCQKALVRLYSSYRQDSGGDSGGFVPCSKAFLQRCGGSIMVVNGKVFLARPPISTIKFPEELAHLLIDTWEITDILRSHKDPRLRGMASGVTLLCAVALGKILDAQEAPADSKPQPHQPQQQQLPPPSQEEPTIVLEGNSEELLDPDEPGSSQSKPLPKHSNRAHTLRPARLRPRSLKKPPPARQVQATPIAFEGTHETMVSPVNVAALASSGAPSSSARQRPASRTASAVPRQAVAAMEEGEATAVPSGQQKKAPFPLPSSHTADPPSMVSNRQHRPARSTAPAATVPAARSPRKERRSLPFSHEETGMGRMKAATGYLHYGREPSGSGRREATASSKPGRSTTLRGERVRHSFEPSYTGAFREAPAAYAPTEDARRVPITRLKGKETAEVFQADVLAWALTTHLKKPRMAVGGVRPVGLKALPTTLKAAVLECGKSMLLSVTPSRLRRLWPSLASTAPQSFLHLPANLRDDLVTVLLHTFLPSEGFLQGIAVPEEEWSLLFKWLWFVVQALKRSAFPEEPAVSSMVKEQIIQFLKATARWLSEELPPELQQHGPRQQYLLRHTLGLLSAATSSLVEALRE